MDKSLKESLTSSEVWMRGVFILIFALFYGLSKIVVGVIAVFQFISLLVTRGCNTRLGAFSLSLSAYIYQLLQFIMGNSDEKPFPFSDWPAAQLLTPGTTTVKKKATRKKTSSKKKAVSDNRSNKPDTPE